MIFEIGNTAYLPGSSSVVLLEDSRNLTVDGDYPHTSFSTKNSNPGITLPETINFVKWGRGDRLPLDMIANVYKNVTVGANIDFNNRLGVGDGIMVFRQIRVGNKLEIQPLLESEAPEVFDFLLKCNYNRILQEMVADINVFGDANAEILIGKDGKSVSRIGHREICYSRLSETNKNGEIEWHGYSPHWHKDANDVVVSRYLDRRYPYLDLMRKLGIEIEDNGDKSDKGYRRFVLSMSQPVPGRFYYNKPYWWSIFEAGWYDFACAIPEFKRALINNQMVIKWQVQISNGFWDLFYRERKLSSDEDKQKARREFLKSLDDFIAGRGNAGKTIVLPKEWDKIKGVDRDLIKIVPVDNGLKGGEYISDSEEVSNIICYAMGVHPSLIGANPGKNGTISGSEARELFTIKQSMLKPIRLSLVAPLYIAKKLNRWPDDIHFAIPNMVLTTLDKGTGSEKMVGNEKL